MHIIIPMSGLGNRFIKAGYKIPKPLIIIEEKPIIEHVCNLFPKADKFTFICNSFHLKTTKMREILLNIRPNSNIVEIPKHKKGPVYAVSKISNLIDDDEEVIVNYCDFGTYWNFDDFLKHTRNRNCDGAIPSYRGFHPHMMGSTNYAFIKEKNQWLIEIKEKEPFTNNRMQEYASNGTYYFKRGYFVKKYFNLLMDLDINLNGEYYVSLVYNLMVKENLKISIYEIQHMLQWGTPEDVEEYLMWSNYFDKLVANNNLVKYEYSDLISLIPMAGLGSRFSREGYQTPKPLIEISGLPMVVQAVNALPLADNVIFVCQKKHNLEYSFEPLLKKYFKCKLVEIDYQTEGQAITSELGLKGIDINKKLLISASDNSIIYNEKKLNNLILNSKIDAIIFTFKNHVSSNNNPEMYGWVDEENGVAKSVSVKKPISETPKNDHAIVGTFLFKSIKIFLEALDKLKSENIRVNGEFYVDSVMHILISQGYNVHVFEVDNYVCWGTPNDFKTFKYWQSYFHKSENKYLIENDINVNKNRIHELKEEFFNFKQKHF